MRLGRFDDSRTCFESLRPLGESALADTCIKKLDDVQEKAETIQKHRIGYKIQLNKFSTLIKVPETSSNDMSKTEGK